MHICPALFAQDNLGIAGSTRSPVNTVLNNPSTIVDSRAFIDINLIGASAFVRNDLVFLDGKSFSLAGLSKMSTVPLSTKNGPFAAYGDVMVHGPSFTFAVKDQAFGVYSAARVVVDARGIPDNLKGIITNGFQHQEEMGQEKTIKNLRANALAWGELGVNYGRILSRDGDAILQGGITVKRLYGAAGAGVRIDNWTYVVRDSSHLETKTFNGEYGFNDPTAGPLIAAKGWGMDIGLTYKLRKSGSGNYMPHSPCTDGDYRFRVGVSLLDFGKVSFSGPFYRNRFDQSESRDWQNFQGTSANEVSDIDSLFNSNFNLVQVNSQDGRFRMKLPTAISAQIDYNIKKNFYVYGVVTYGLPRLNSTGVQRASYLGIAPRWEVKRWEIALPLSLYEWKQPQMGLCVRLNSFIIGSDNLGWLLFKQDIYGVDFYCSVKYTIFKHWKCTTGKIKKGKPVPRKNGHGTIPCPSW